MKKKLLATFLALCMVIGLLPISAFASGDNTDEAKIGEQSYGTLENAIGAVQPGGTIQLTADVKLADDTPLKIVDKGTADNSITLDLNGHTISGSNSKNGTNEDTTTPGGILWIYGSYVTLTDTSTGDEKGGIINTSTGSSAAYGLVVRSTANNVGAVTIDGGVRIDVTGSTSGNARAIHFQNNTNTNGTLTLTIENAKVTANKGHTVYASTGSGCSCMVTINGGEFKSTGKANTTDTFSGSSATMTINGGTFYNWGTSAWNEVAKDHVICIAQPTNSDSFTVTIAAQAPDNYVALVDSTDVYRAIYLTEGSNLYLIHNIQTPAGTNGSGRTIHVKKDVSYTFPSGKYYGNSTSNDASNYHLTLDLTEGVTLSGGMNLYSADVTVTGEGALSDDFAWSPAEGYEMTANGETDGLYSCRLTTGAQAELTKADGTTVLYNTVVGAITAARLSPGSTAKMLADYTNTLAVTVNKYNGVVADFTLDLNGHTYTYSGATQAITVNDGAKLIVTDSSESGGGSIITAGGRTAANAAIAATGTGGTIIIEEGVTVKNLVLLDAPNSKLTVAGTIDTTGFNTYAISGNGSTGKGGTEITIKETAVIKADAEKAAAPAIYHPQSGTLTVEGGEISGYGGIQMCSGDLIITGNPTITATGSDDTANKTGDGGIPDGAAISAVNRSYPGGEPTVTITGTPEVGAASGVDAVQAYTWSSNAENDWSEASTKVKISGGYYTSDVTKYCVSGKIAITNSDGNKETYGYKVDVPTVTDTDTAVAGAVASGDTAAAVNIANADDSIEEAAKAVAESVGLDTSDSATVNALLSAADNISEEVANAEAAEAVAKLKANDITTDEETAVTLVREIYLDVTVTDYTVSETKKSVVFQIEPKYNLYATVSEVAADKGELVDVGSVSANQKILIEKGKPIKLTDPVVVPMNLPSGFVTDANTPVYVKHTKDSGEKYVYKATVTSKDDTEMTYTAAFTNPHGFSTFELTTEVAASITDDNDVTTYYATLQDAVDAVQDSQTITLKQDGLSATVKGNKTFTVKSEDGKKYTATLTAAFGYTLKENEDGSYTITKNTSSSGGSGTTTYVVNLPSDVTNGTLAASPKSAAKGATVTLTVTPDSGYQLAGLVVTDANGNAIALTDKGNGQYTFVMPASKVNVAATFEKIPAVHDCPSEKFTDVDQSAWYHEGVDYAILKGMMNGTEPTLFEPNSTTTRAMIVTILYRLEGSPAVSGANPFTDVDAGTWYTDTVAWAADKGVVTGTSPTTFDPNDPITREQMAAILYRYASYKGYDVAEKADLTGYTDAGKISAYAADAMAWTNAQGLITGETPTTLVPQGNATRAQVATILMRFCENVAK